MTETVFFKVDCEWLCNFVRQRVYREGVPFTEGLKLLKESFNIDDATALLILTGAKKVVGINGGDLVDDDKQKDYLDYIARTEKKAAETELKNDIDLHPFNYMDPFGTRWSYKEFVDQAIDNPTLEQLKSYFGGPPCEGTVLEGGLYSIDFDFLRDALKIREKITASDEDQEKFYQKLYDYWGSVLATNTLDGYDKALVEQRQRVYRAWKRRQEERQTEEVALMTGQKTGEKKETRALTWQIQDDNTYNYCEAGEVGGYLSQAKLVPSEDTFASHGIISPKGDYYSCDFAGHEACAVVLCYQSGYFKDEIPKDLEKKEGINPILYLLVSDDASGVEFRQRAKDMLYEKGWVFVNSAYGYGGTFYSKYGELEDMPQAVMNTAYDYIIKEREGELVD